MKFLTIRQPWASLIAAGVKTIETRPWSTKYRGPLAIHAGAFVPIEGKEYGTGWWWTLDDEPIIVNQTSVNEGRGWQEHPAPLGAVVAVCDLVDVVPMVDAHGCTDHTAHLCIVNESMLLHSKLDQPWGGGETEHIVSDQLPFGIFEPGRFAWLLDNVRPLTAPVPMKGAQGLRDVPADVAESIEKAASA